MTTDQAPVDQYDPDAPPESSFIAEMVGTLVVNTMVTSDNLKEQEPKTVESVIKYWGDRRKDPIWFLEAHGISAVRDDGAPFRMSDIISLTSKDGKWLSKGMAPDVIATAYRGLGVTASYTQNGQPTSALGRTFHFKEFVMNPTKVWKKRISLYPIKLYGLDEKYDGEITIVEAKKETAGGAPVQSAPKVSEGEAVKLLQDALAGKTPSQMFDAILESTQLKSVGTLFGVSLMEAATDESLANVLVENKVLALVDGVFQVPA